MERDILLLYGRVYKSCLLHKNLCFGLNKPMYDESVTKSAATERSFLTMAAQIVFWQNRRGDDEVQNCSR